MSKHDFYIVDVFAESKYAGNQLAVFRRAADIPSEMMQKIARETNFAETTFILSDDEREGGFDVRIFTPEDEVPFAGHPTLGTSYIIRNEIIGKPIESLKLNLKVGQIPVTFKQTESGQEILWMRQIQPKFGKTLEVGIVAEMLGLKTADFDTRFPIMEVSTGLPFVIAPLKTMQAVKSMMIDQRKYWELVENLEAKDIMVFSPETYNRDHQLNARVFPLCHGIPEDPATGSANGCLAGYLVRSRYFDNDKIDICVEQGYEIGRPSKLYLKAEQDGDNININVGGKVQMVARGEFE